MANTKEIETCRDQWCRRVFRRCVTMSCLLLAVSSLGCWKSNSHGPAASVLKMEEESITDTAQGESEGKDPRHSPSDFGPGRFLSDFRTGALFQTPAGDGKVGKGPRFTTKVWLSKNLARALSIGRVQAPEGSVAIKEMESGSKLGVMIKMGAGYDVAHGDWYYEVRNQEGELMQEPPSGKVVSCIACHGKFAASDYLPGMPQSIGH